MKGGIVHIHNKCILAKICAIAVVARRKVGAFTHSVWELLKMCPCFMSHVLDSVKAPFMFGTLGLVCKGYSKRRTVHSQVIKFAPFAHLFYVPFFLWKLPRCYIFSMFKLCEVLPKQKSEITQISFAGVEYRWESVDFFVK